MANLSRDYVDRKYDQVQKLVMRPTVAPSENDAQAAPIAQQYGARFNAINHLKRRAAIDATLDD